MLKISTTVSIAAFFMMLTGCFNSRWTDKQRKDFELKCSQTDTFNKMVVEFRGFENTDFDSVLVKEYKDTTLISDFKIFVWPSASPQDKERKERSATITQTMNINHQYKFILPGQEPIVLANMKMIMWAQYTMYSEGWGCVMGDYTLDGVRFEHSANPVLIKHVSSKTN